MKIGVKLEELKKHRVLTFSNGFQLSYDEEKNNIEVWFNFETIGVVNLDSVTTEFASQIITSYGLEIELEVTE